VRDVRDGAVVSDVDVESVRLVVHSHHIAVLHHAGFLGEVRLREGRGVAGVSELLAHELVLPVGCLVLAAVFGHEAWDYERHGCWYIIPFSFGLVLGGGFFGL